MKTAQKTRPRDAVITLKKMPEKDSLPAQAFAILEVLKAKGGELPASELTKAMKTRVQSVQGMPRIWIFYRARLVKLGCIALRAIKKRGAR
jgi:hypothetical protein